MSAYTPTSIAAGCWPPEAGYAITEAGPFGDISTEETSAITWIRDYRPSPPPAAMLLTETMAETYALQALPDGWNGYDGVAPPPSTVRRAIQWLQDCYRACDRVGQPWHRPNVTASTEGEVVYEWWADDRVLTVYVEADGIQYLKFGRGEGASLREHGSAEDSSACVGLIQWFSE